MADGWSKRYLITLVILVFVATGIPVWHFTTTIIRPKLPFDEARAFKDTLYTTAPCLPTHLHVAYLQAAKENTQSQLPNVVLSALSGAFKAPCFGVKPLGAQEALDAFPALHVIQAAINSPASTCKSLSEALSFALSVKSEASTNGNVHVLLVVDSRCSAGAVAVSRSRSFAVVLPPNKDAEHALKVIGATLEVVLGGAGASTATNKQLPLGSSALHLSLELAVAHPYPEPPVWDFESQIEASLAKALSLLKPFVNVEIRSQVRYHSEAALNGTWAASAGAYVVTKAQLPHWMHSTWGEAGHGFEDAATAAKGPPCAAPGALQEPEGAPSASAVRLLRWVAYVPPPWQNPLKFESSEGAVEEASGGFANGFWLPDWGGALVLQPEFFKRQLPPEDDPEGPITRLLNTTGSQHIVQTVVTQLRAVLGLPDSAHLQGKLPEEIMLHFGDISQGIAGWELDILARAQYVAALKASAKGLNALANIVEALPNLALPPSIGQYVRGALQEQKLAVEAAEKGKDEVTVCHANRALLLSDAAYHHPAVMTQLSIPQEHKLAMYLPLFLPLLLPLLKGVYTEANRAFAKRRRPAEKQD